ncbi:MAG TPA: rhomboid family intramembrane serine protease [Gaiellaceae bacterium]|nr:rhomboid family intramembrane serine protease [Gaiellaceae bacterium]
MHVFRDGFYPCALHGPCHLPPGYHHLPWYEGVFTGMFMHASWAHILGNMLFFWIFGNNVEDALGHVGFLVWYLVAGIVAMTVQSIVTLSFAGVSASVPNIGASGAIAGILGAYFVLLPRAKVLTVIFLGIILSREIPAVRFLGIWIGLQLWSGGLTFLQPQSGGGRAFFAHIGGFAFGLATGLVLLATRRRPHAPHSNRPAW